MASHRLGGIGLSEAGPSTHHHHHVPYGSLLQGINTPASTLINQGPAFNFGELEEAIVLQGVNSRNDEGKASLFTGKPAATLEMFPSWPMRFQQTAPRGGSKSGGESTDSALSTKTEPPFEAESPMSSSKKAASSSDNHHHGHQAFEFDQQQPTQQLQHDMMMANDHDHASRTGPSQNQSSPAKSPQEKIMMVFATLIILMIACLKRNGPTRAFSILK